MADKTTPDQSPMQATNSTKNVLNGDVEIKGSIKFTSELTFDGKLEGDVQTEGMLTIGENATITGNINAQTVLSRGKVNGNIIAKDKVELKARSELFGDIRAAKLMMEEGVTFVGKIEVNPNKAVPNPTALRPSEPPKALEAGKPPGR